ncbi:hypothetical protein DFH08DRAFT_975088 [Mycena albidolilacea]|uniref:Uncharacterized protein n=1 Tax=Mycena albidolilacea TaxID=1033008 RepID=A0AAD6Z5I0_9AGAR|nr:hypothetical protein DFH08DRAFT_975088 [Mycena albidolilacea]
MENLKKEGAIEDLGEAALAQKDLQGLALYLQSRLYADLMREIIDTLGRKEYEALTEEERQEQLAFESLIRGGVKTCAIAGAIMNNKDDKIGQGARHVEFFTATTGKTHQCFPYTSNTRFGSYGLATAELIKFLDYYLEFLEVIEYTKMTISLTNIDVNLQHALNDPSLLSVDQRKLDDPDLQSGSDMLYATVALDAQPWEDEDAVDAVVKPVPRLINLRPITLDFFRGALATWIRFSAEFAPGGLIDTASPAEQQAAWMSSTNDANKGALGTISMRE